MIYYLKKKPISQDGSISCLQFYNIIKTTSSILFFYYFIILVLYQKRPNIENIRWIACLSLLIDTIKRDYVLI